MAEDGDAETVFDGAIPVGMAALTELYHQLFTGLILTLVSRRNATDAAEWMFRVFRHQHHEKFLPGLEKLGLTGMPDAVACAAYHYLSNSVGGVDVEYVRESDCKAWVRFVPPRWIYPGATICGVPGEVSRAMLRGWYAQNGVSLGNPRLGFVCTAQTMDGDHGLAGYFLEYDRDIDPDERLQFRPGELPPRFDPSAAPPRPDHSWSQERRARTARNYAMEYVRSGLPRLVEIFGSAEASHLGRVSAHHVGAQSYRALARAFEIAADDAAAFGRFLCRFAELEGDTATTQTAGDGVLVHRRGWRLMRALSPISGSVVESWNGLFQGALAVHNRFLVLELLARPDFGDEGFTWRVRPRAM